MDDNEDRQPLCRLGLLNRGLQEGEVADSDDPVILRQIANGLAVHTLVPFLVN